MDILGRARKDAAMILNKGGFDLYIKLTDLENNIIETRGLGIRRTDTLDYDDGSKTMSPFSSITIPFSALPEKKYYTLKDWQVEFDPLEDSNIYKISDGLPNRTLRIFNCTLRDVKNNN